MNIGLTGGIACGKSTVSAMLVSRGALLVDADQIARDVVQPGSPVLEQVAAHFGQAVIQEDGSLHRKKLGEIVFGNTDARKQLEHILHPPIRKMIREQMEAYEKQFPDKLVVVDIPLLFESDLSFMFEEVLVVYVPPHIQVERLMRRDNLTESAANNRINAQMSIEEKRKLADIVIDNSGTWEDTLSSVERFWLGKGLS
ncbi:dephospho-CoA kinase [Paenibacillus sp. CGMCC 1.16610]|uniref:Dephospho-CoA kinase n=1 Tax=Paenibacillus anseongense TaxID=2682845 RepID=A0ABW9UGK0_9BACL|nr:MULTISPECIES: dephospho-CoA kinase [Paenibacillus]MBA2943954.1 dephospho-CoA kinase [Paenibacillus sp. CGMCC 1.16610]MVQ37843.1 dephospho-CoA kinase [Paenibacillus anseongense]